MLGDKRWTEPKKYGKISIRTVSYTHLDVYKRQILRYENGSIDNTKKMVLEGLSEALHVSIEWLRGETDEYETDITDKKELQIRDAIGDILKQLPLDLSKKEDAFSKDLLLLMLKQYNLCLLYTSRCV